MNNLLDRVYEVINTNEMLYEEHEFQIQMHMKNRWRDAFIAASANDFDDSFPEAVTTVAAEAEEAVTDHDRFINDLQAVIRYLAKGGRLVNGEPSI